VRFRFGENEVNVSTRTLVHAGRSLSVEPKVFDMLVMLLAHRDRVVTKDELLATVWGGRVVTDGVLTHTIMKARRLIGDKLEPPVIRTLHRVGYRFVADVEVLDGSATGAPSPAAAAGARVGVLPFRDDTGRPDLAWVDLGLMATTRDLIAALGGEGCAVPVGELLAVVGTHDPGLQLDAAAARLATALGAVDVVQAALSQAAPAGLSLAYRACGPRLQGLQGALQGPDPVQLSHQLARLVAARLAAPGGAAGPPGALASPDERFADAAQARAMKAMHEERWAGAARLLRVALDHRPQDAALQLDYARCLVGLRDPRAVPVLQATLAQSRLAGRTGLELRAVHLLARHRHAEGDFLEAERLLVDGLRRAEACADDAELELHLLLASGETLTCLGNPGVASWMLDRVERLAERLGNQVATAQALDIRGRIAVCRAQPEAALKAFEQAARLNEQVGLNAGAAYSLTHVGHCLRDAGRFAQAAGFFVRAFQRALLSGNPSAIGLCGVCSLRFGGAPPSELSHADAVLAQMRGQGAIPGATELAEAFVLARRGRLPACIAALDRAEQGMAGSPSLAFHLCMLRIRVLVCLGLLEEALDLCHELRARAGGRLQRPMRGASLHLRALVACAEGRRTDALALLHDSLHETPPSLARADAVLDAAWLMLDAGDPAAARSLLAGIAPFMQAARAGGYPPAQRVEARCDGVPAAGDADVRHLPSQHELAAPAAAPAGQAHGA